jgi:hypothetical protein
MAILADHYPHLLPAHSSSNQLATRVTLPFMGGSELRSGEGLGTSLDEAMQIVKPLCQLMASPCGL